MRKTNRIKPWYDPNKDVPVVNNNKPEVVSKMVDIIRDNKKTSIPLDRYIKGLEGVDINKVALAGEDLIENRMRISIIDLPEWIRQGARMEMTQEDIKVIKEYIDNL